MSDRLIKVSESLSVEVTESHLRIVRKAGGLVHVRKDEIARLINALAAGDLELERGAMTAEAEDYRTDEEKDADDRQDWLEWLHGKPDQPGGFDESPIAGEDDAAGKPDDFYDGGERHSDVW